MKGYFIFSWKRHINSRDVVEYFRGDIFRVPPRARDEVFRYYFVKRVAGNTTSIKPKHFMRYPPMRMCLLGQMRLPKVFCSREREVLINFIVSSDVNKQDLLRINE